MEAPAARPNILHLGGVTLRDFVPIEDVFDEKVLEVVELSGQAAKPPPFEKIPAVFSSVKEWPLFTNLRCWSCAFTFDTPPCFVPTSVRAKSDDRVEIGVEGNFCTFNCAARYIDDMYPPQAFAAKHWRMRDNLCLVYYYFKGLRVHHIEPAPRKTELIGFGGNLDEETFWARLREIDPQYDPRAHRRPVAPERMHELDPQHGLRAYRRPAASEKRMRPEPGGATVWTVCLDDGAKGVLRQAPGPKTPTALTAKTPTALTALTALTAKTPTTITAKTPTTLTTLTAKTPTTLTAKTPTTLTAKTATTLTAKTAACGASESVRKDRPSSDGKTCRFEPKKKKKKPKSFRAAAEKLSDEDLDALLDSFGL
ncbi:BA71V-B175L protein [Elysia marginata]|uniref:BA71V-B175L protein n=1 Tax=Elysia marginata TaxID=1093978 RepID=A0AAV4GVD9_9GAST|nr:BA71V-B175L protein [Elysia marginata]